MPVSVLVVGNSLFRAERTSKPVVGLMSKIEMCVWVLLGWNWDWEARERVMPRPMPDAPPVCTCTVVLYFLFSFSEGVSCLGLVEWIHG